MNEKEWIESALEAPEKRYRTFNALMLYATYLGEQGYHRNDIHKALEVFLVRCDPGVNLIAWQEIIESAIKKASGRTLRQIDGVWISKAEMDRIAELKGVMMRRLMFTILCVVKFMNATRTSNNNWVNCGAKALFNMANVKISAKRQALMLNDLWQAGYIGFSRAVDNTNIDVRIVEQDANDGVFVDDFRNLGNRYMMLTDNGYMKCESCGLIIKRRSIAQRYCADCAQRIHIQNTIEAYHRSVA